MITPVSASLRHFGIFDVSHTDEVHAFYPPQVLTISATSNCFFNMPVNHLPESALGIDLVVDEDNLRERLSLKALQLRPRMDFVRV